MLNTGRVTNTDVSSADQILINVDQLAGLINQGRDVPTVLDVRWRLGGAPGLGSYLEGHLPGAVFIDLDGELSARPGQGGRHPLPETAGFQAVMRRAGVRNGHPVVVYDDGDEMPAARAWWVLRYFGHPAVRVLDGGFRAWASAGQPVTPDAGEPAAGDFTAEPGHMPLLDAKSAAAIARSGVLLDARAAERYRGETEPVDPVGGHIPGARNLPTSGDVQPDGRFKDTVSLRERFAELCGKDVGVYCGSGVSAAREVLALHLAGIPAALYVGSWSHWITDPSRPVATGPDAGQPAHPPAL